MVQIAHSTPTFTSIIVRTETIAIAIGPFLRCTIVIVGTDVCRGHLIRLTLVFLLGEVHPIADILAMVYNHIGYSAYTLLLEGRNHRAQLLLVAKRTVVVLKPPQVVVTHRCTTTVTTLGYPYQIEGSSQIVSLLL